MTTSNNGTDGNVDWGAFASALDEVAAELEIETKRGERSDGVYNAFSGLGDPNSDRHEHTAPGIGRAPLQRVDLDSQYEHGRITRRLVESAPDDCTRKGWRLVVDADDRSDPVARDFKRMTVRQKLREAHVLANITGGAGVLIATDDNAPLDQPIDLASVRSIRGLHVFDRYELRHHYVGTQAIDDASCDFDEPETYLLTPHSTVGHGRSVYHQREVHRSRIIRFEGAYVRRERRFEYDGWGQSLIDSLWASLRDFETVSGALATTIHEFKYGVLKLQNLQWLMTGPDGQQSNERLKQRLRLMMLSKSLIKALVLDADRESYDTREINVTGLDVANAIFQQNLAASAHMSLTKLFGQAPKGFTSEDTTGQENWDDHCMSQQDRWYYPGLMTLAELVLLVNEGELPEQYDILFNPLRTSTELEKAQTYFTVAQADEKYLAMGVIDEEQIHTRFERAEFGVDLMLEPDALLPVDELEVLDEEVQADDLDDVPVAAPSPDPVPSDLVSLRDAAATMGVPTHTVSALTRKGALRFWKLGSHRRVSLQDVVDLGRNSAQSTLVQDALRADSNAHRWMLCVRPPTEFVDRLEIEARDRGLVLGSLPHVTLVYGGARPSTEPVEFIADAVREHVADLVADQRDRPAMRVSGAGAFFNGAEQVAHLLVSGPGLAELRAAMFTRLSEAGLLPHQTHGFIPHLTLQYFDAAAPPPPDWIDVARADYPEWRVTHIDLVVDNELVASFELGKAST